LRPEVPAASRCYSALPSVPNGLTATTVSSTQLNLSWNASSGATGYNVKRAPASGGPYATIAANTPGLAYPDTGLTPGTFYYYVVSGTNASGESANSTEAFAETISITPPILSYGINSGVLQFSWPSDHIGWRLQSQTNGNGGGLGTNWFTVSPSSNTNHIPIAIDPTAGNVFFRLIYP